MRCVFQAMAGFLGRVDSETRCAFWAEEPVDHGFDRRRLITVDLARTPSAAAAKQISWDEVQVDDCFTGPNGAVSGTTLGPRWPELRLAGVVYLEQGFVAALPAALRPAWPPPGVTGEPHEFTTAVTDAGQRTLRMLSQTLRLPVFGTRKPLLKSHSTSVGFDPAFDCLLTEASATHPALGTAGSRHGGHQQDR